MQGVWTIANNVRISSHVHSAMSGIIWQRILKPVSAVVPTARSALTPIHVPAVLKATLSVAAHVLYKTAHCFPSASNAPLSSV